MSKYAASYGRMMALKGNLLSESDFKRLVETQSINDAIVMLGDMGYDGLLDQRESLDDKEIQHTLEQDLITSHIKIFSFLSGNPLKFANLLMQRFELTNLKTILRVLISSSSAETATPFILRLGKFQSLPIDELLATQSMEECIEALKNTPYEDASKRAYEVYNSDQNLFSMEVALELDYYNRFIKSLKFFNDKSLSQIIGIEIDAKCISWALRFRYNYKLKPEKIFQYMVAGRWQFSDKLFWDVISSDDIEGTISALSSSPYRRLFSSIGRSDNDIIEQIEILLQQDLYQKARSWFLKYPLRISVLLAYLLLKESEVHDLIAIIYGKLFDIPQERIERYLIITQKARKASP